jgi:hypothetical protein
MGTIELIYTFTIAILGVHAQFMYRFLSKTPANTPFDLKKWFGENTIRYIFSLTVMVVLFMAIRWTSADGFYTKYILSKYPALEIFKPHAIIAAIIGFYGTQLVISIVKKVESKDKK